MESIVVGIAEGKVVKAPQVLVSYALGSCVGVCLYDAKNRIAGMAHVMLPDRSASTAGNNEYKFADEGIRRLLREMKWHGAQEQYITAKIAGGAKMFAFSKLEFEIGAKNVESVKKTLKELGIKLVGEDVGKNYGRTVLLYGDSGSVEVRSLKGIKLVL
ncbi:chemotaxis protein CheD [Bariatricus massiliensis]|uniref:Probable chemoreceptor glutamine deamidase CheD n=1 Tax=Bariatricus massiliensis TaxID=1745713 RepID=A0ABS8DLB8_9FIRM|nr:chemotaxis protein CheD [Bariatricus massiliensis]MCB7306092.1 chemotaxis protein CheD [Bariatricus massiliensis]MCB7376539.1 chemotaxis protein CheD [Bariatricus massiliensis]MCB7389235.1 chemotaxis protein CheD [Bariatricus massiliensis]MCB7413408.1 chemotaxis protein CheD [Bariatricus massiliensis]MCQ5255264.1 chemotaxis protein CheD [Bariatricus massiliensis]